MTRTMRPIRYLFLALCLLAPGPSLAAGEVFVRAGFAIGRGILIPAESGCMLLTVAHVVTQPGGERRFKHYPIRTYGRAGHEAEAQGVRLYGDDIALLRLDADTGLCREARCIDVAGLDGLLEGVVEDGAIRARTQSGGYEQLLVNIRRYDDRYVTVMPKRSDDVIAQGLSGAVLYAGDQPVGMLQTVSENGRRGRVFRFDRIAELTRSYLEGFACRTPYPPQPPSTARGHRPVTGPIVDAYVASAHCAMTGVTGHGVDTTARNAIQMAVSQCTLLGGVPSCCYQGARTIGIPGYSAIAACLMRGATGAAFGQPTPQQALDGAIAACIANGGFDSCCRQMARSIRVLSP